MEIVLTLGIAAFLVAAAVFAFGLPPETIDGDVLAAKGFPLVTIGIGLLLCAILVVRQIRAGKAKGEKLIDFSKPGGRAIGFSALALAAYLAVLNLLGFVLSTLLYTAAAAVVMGYRKPWKLAVFAAAATAGLVLLFGKAFFVPLPRGVGILKELSYLIH